ncbi:WD repeat-containing protein [Aureococcus anophagefferens]|nr:WD repeat-containing protein [Aureococcus anophagefferens]
MKPKTVVVVVSRARSGTDFLVSMLNDADEVCVKDETLRELGVDWWDQRAAAGLSEEEVERDHLRRVQEKLDMVSSGDFRKPYRRRRSAPCHSDNVTGFKWFNGQGLIYPYEDNARARRYRAQSDVFRGWLARIPRLLSVWKSNIQPDFNGLGKYVSGIMKRDKSLATHCAAGNATCVAELNAKRITVDVDDLLKRSVTAEAKHWAEMRARAAARGIIVILRRETTRAWASSAGRPYLHVDFADLAAEPDATMARVFAFLGVPPRAANSPLEKSIQRPVHEMIANFGDVRAALAHTPWRDDPASMAEFANPTPTAARGFDYGSTVGEPRVFDAGGVVYGVALTRDGTRAAAGIGCGDDNACKVWDVTTGALVHTLAGHDRDVTGCAFSGDGTARLWDCGSGAELARLGESIPEEGEKFVTSVSFAADGATVATGHCENKAELWDVATGAKLGVLEGHAARVCGVSFSGGNTVATCGYDHVVRVWDSRTFEQVAVLGEEGEGYAAWVPCCALADDGASVLAGGQFGELTLWDVKTQTITASITAGHKARQRRRPRRQRQDVRRGSGDCTASVRKLP